MTKVDQQLFSSTPWSVESALAQEFWRYCTVPISDLSAVTSPVYIYHGETDTSALANNVDVWSATLASAAGVTVREYPGKGH